MEQRLITQTQANYQLINRHIRRIENTIMKAHFGGKMFRNESR